jgi:hypothetical protein
MDYIDLAYKVVAVVGALYAVAQVVVLVTPTNKDNEILAKVEGVARAFLEVAANVRKK